jgi:hypothetical protein
VEFRQETVISIDAARKRVLTDRGVHDADVLVVVLGADLDVAATPGLAECGHEFYSPEGAARLAGILAGFNGGNVVIGVLGAFFKCPPAPYEAAFMLHDLLTKRGVRDACTIHLVTPCPSRSPSPTRFPTPSWPCATSGASSIRTPPGSTVWTKPSGWRACETAGRCRLTCTSPSPSTGRPG